MFIDLEKELQNITAYQALENAPHFKSLYVKENLEVFVNELDEILISDISISDVKTKSEELYQSLLGHIDYLADIVTIDIRASYFRNVVNAIYRIFKNKVEERLFVYYKDKGNKILNNYTGIIKNIDYGVLDPEELLNLILKEYKLIPFCPNRGSAILAVNRLVKHCNAIKIQRI